MITVASPKDHEIVIDIDDDATKLYAEQGLTIDIASEHPFIQAEQARWRRAAEQGRMFLYRSSEGEVQGFAVLDVLDSAPYLDQLSVRRSAMRRGVGRYLLQHAIAWAEQWTRSNSNADPHLWLTTYAHLPFNGEFYVSEGFEIASDVECSPTVKQHLDEQRKVLPASDQRVAMRRPLGSTSIGPASRNR